MKGRTLFFFLLLLLLPAAAMAGGGIAGEPDPQVGAVAPDFSATAADGRRQSLYGLDAGRLTLLLFYDPDCGDCRRELFALRHAAAVRSAVADSVLHVMAVCVGESDTLWQQSLGEMPAEWTAVKADKGFADSGLYSLDVLPQMLLLDADRRIMLLGADTRQLTYVLSRLWE